MKTFWQKLEGTTDQILAEIARLIDEGNVRRVVVKQRGRTVAEFPVTIGVIGAVIAPLAAAIGAIAAVLADCTIEVERTAEGSGSRDQGTGAGEQGPGRTEGPD